MDPANVALSPVIDNSLINQIFILGFVHSCINQTADAVLLLAAAAAAAAVVNGDGVKASFICPVGLADTGRH